MSEADGRRTSRDKRKEEMVGAAVTASALPAGASTSALQTANNTLVGAVTETAPATDTASSGLNGRLQRIAQRITTAIASLVSIDGKLPATLGQKASSASMSVVHASDAPMLTLEQVKIEAGKMFQHTRKHSSVSSGGTVEYVLVTPASPNVRLMAYIYEADGSPVDVYLYEGITTVSDGTAEPIMNMSRNGASAACALTHTPTTPSGGTEITYHLLPDVAKAGGTGEGNGAHWILKPSTKYLFRVTNNDTGSNDISTLIRWSEG